jgi:hypothetical protein
VLAVEAMASPAVPTMEATAAAPMPTVEAVPTMKATAAAPMPSATPRVPRDGTGEEHRGQDDDPHPLLEFTSTLMPVIHGVLL